MSIAPFSTHIVAMLLAVSIAAVIYVLNYTKWVFPRRGYNNKKRLITGSIVSLLLIGANINGVYRTVNHYKLALIDYSDLPASSPISIHILNQAYSSFIMNGYSYINRKELSLSTSCQKLQVRDQLQVSYKVEIDDDLKKIRRNIYSHALDDYPMAANCFLDASDETEDDILKNKWWRFGGSSVWLEKYQVHFMVSRIIYSSIRLKSDPTISVLNVQVFDKNWKELKDHAIEVTDENGKKNVLRFPDILKIPIDLPPANKFMLMGPEDPRVLVRKFRNSKGELDEEPVIIFNMLSDAIDKKRGMHGFKPFDNNRFVLFRLKGVVPRKKEKNWVPFFDEDPDEDSESINFVYDIDPLLIVRCSFINGYCERVSGPRFKENLEEDKEALERIFNETGVKPAHVGPLRGGTNMIPIPSTRLPPHIVEGKKYWLGFPRSHIDGCGCLKLLYRPHLMIISKDTKTGKFEIEYVSSLLDFNMKVLPWDVTKSVCDNGAGKSVLIPNSISYWGFIEDENGDVAEDFMGLSLSEADSNVAVLHMTGLWTHLINVLDRGYGGLETVDTTKEGSGGMKKTSSAWEFDEDDFDVPEYQGKRLVGCSIDDSDYYCKFKAITDNWYGENGEYIEVEEEEGEYV